MAKANKLPIPADLIEERVIGIPVAAQIVDLSEWTLYKFDPETQRPTHGAPVRPQDRHPSQRP